VASTYCGWLVGYKWVLNGSHYRSGKFTQLPMHTVFPCFGGRGCMVVWFVVEAIIVGPVILTEVPRRFQLVLSVQAVSDSTPLDHRVTKNVSDKHVS